MTPDGPRGQYIRSNKLAAGWVIRQDDERSVMLVNDAPGAEFVQGDSQSRHEEMVGWRTVATILAERGQALANVLRRAADKALKDLGL
jgi:hypothetical protein